MREFDAIIIGAGQAKRAWRLHLLISSTSLSSLPGGASP